MNSWGWVTWSASPQSYMPQLHLCSHKFAQINAPNFIINPPCRPSLFSFSSFTSCSQYKNEKRDGGKERVGRGHHHLVFGGRVVRVKEVSTCVLVEQRHRVVNLGSKDSRLVR